MAKFVANILTPFPRPDHIICPLPSSIWQLTKEPHCRDEFSTNGWTAQSRVVSVIVVRRFRRFFLKDDVVVKVAVPLAAVFYNCRLKTGQENKIRVVGLPNVFTVSARAVIRRRCVHRIVFCLHLPPPVIRMDCAFFRRPSAALNHLGSGSDPTKRLPVRRAAPPAVPEPIQKSPTRSPRFVCFSVSSTIRSTGFSVGCLSSPFRARAMAKE